MRLYLLITHFPIKYLISPNVSTNPHSICTPKRCGNKWEKWNNNYSFQKYETVEE
jgi:hypothetical protein